MALIGSPRAAGADGSSCRSVQIAMAGSGRTKAGMGGGSTGRCRCERAVDARNALRRMWGMGSTLRFRRTTIRLGLSDVPDPSSCIRQMGQTALSDEYQRKASHSSGLFPNVDMVHRAVSPLSMASALWT
ncbi:hypothetical protein PBRA_006067 [Plasmodiophora brassicae]|uniref:Uncharacterized protein n=1 Tax=Plasmodiophora brassicae TaxID=37360 RepID=A0A0G4IRE1_PLABS|nr:hypothetical protein PBRA_006067 [Plasmodiophora brassicae]